MKITSVELYSQYSPDPLVLSFRDPASLNPFQATAIQGLDADEIIQRYYGSGGSGARFYDMRLLQRTLVMRVGLNPRWSLDESYSDLRDEVYRIISASRTGEVSLKFKNGSTVVAVISGFVSKVEASHFSKSPEMQITIKCNDPMFKSENAVSINMTPYDPLDTIVNDTVSTAPHGFHFSVIFPSPATTFTMTGDDWSFIVAPIGTTFETGDILRCDSETNGKDLYITRGVTTIPLMDAVGAGSIWPILFPGANEFHLSAPADWNSFTHYYTYWGV